MPANMSFSTEETGMARPRDRSSFITILRLLAKILPGDYLKTAFYLNVIAKPRKAVRLMLSTFYRMDHIYEVLKEFKNTYNGNFSILEFGTAQGYSFTKMLYATKYLQMDHRVVVHAFDSFEGLAASDDPAEQRRWSEGAFKGDYEVLEAYCQERYRNYKIHKGYFEDTLTESVLEELATQPPILIWIDCDYYEPARMVLERLVPYLPNGCVFYFDDVDVEFGSRFSGEAKLIYEINQGLLSDDIELVLDKKLSLDSRRIYRFVNGKNGRQYERLPDSHWAAGIPRPLGNNSPLP
jgi:hypothetical protein